MTASSWLNSSSEAWLPSARLEHEAIYGHRRPQLLENLEPVPGGEPLYDFPIANTPEARDREAHLFPSWRNSGAPRTGSSTYKLAQVGALYDGMEGDQIPLRDQRVECDREVGEGTLQETEPSLISSAWRQAVWMRRPAREEIGADDLIKDVGVASVDLLEIMADEGLVRFLHRGLVSERGWLRRAGSTSNSG